MSTYWTRYEFSVGETNGGTGFGASPFLQVFAPNGQLVDSATGSDDATVQFSASTTGTYTAIIADVQNDDTLTYRILGTGISTPSLALLGDYNGNNAVDAADYTVWRDTLGSTTDLRANGDDTGASTSVIDQADYDFWKANFGNTTVPLDAAIAVGTSTGEAASYFSSVALPEPKALASGEPVKNVDSREPEASAFGSLRGKGAPVLRDVDTALTRRASTIRIADDDLLLLALGVAGEASDSSAFAIIDEALADEEEDFTLGQPEEVLQPLNHRFVLATTA